MISQLKPGDVLRATLFLFLGMAVCPLMFRTANISVTCSHCVMKSKVMAIPSSRSSAVQLRILMFPLGSFTSARKMNADLGSSDQSIVSDMVYHEELGPECTEIGWDST